MTRALLFPGQGSQAVGMAAELISAYPAARQVVEAVDDALGRSLSRLIAEGPQEKLTLTENAQPALMAISMAVLRVLETEGPPDLVRRCAFVAGHSLGEYTALTAVGSLQLAASARLLRVRGEAMQRAVPAGQGAMAALLGADAGQAREIAELAAEGEVCEIANDNAPGQIVLSGATAAIGRAINIAKGHGIRKSVRLPVSAPFHCRMMASAAEVMKTALSETPPTRPEVPLIANVTAAPVEDPDEIQTLLVEQVTAMVRWRESVQAMRAAGVNTVIELGAGKVLSGLVRRIDREMTVLNAETPGDVEAVLGTF